MLHQVRSGYSGYVRIGLVKSGYVRLSPVCSDWSG